VAVTDRASRRLRRALLAVAGVVAVAVVALGADRVDEVRALPPLPATSRHDLALAVDARREGGGVTVGLVLGVAAGAEDDLRVVDWGGDAGDWSTRGLWDAGSPGWWWSPAVRDERGPGGSIVLHVGAGRLVDPEGLLRMEPLADHVRAIDPGREVRAEVHLDAAGSPEVRVCVWAAGTDPDDPGDRPATCADDRVPAS
jgi:hypothetical protein